MAQKDPKGGGTSTPGQMDNNHMFLKRALETLLNEKDMKKSQFQPLKRACEAALGSLPENIQQKSIVCFFQLRLTKIRPSAGS